MGQASRKLAAVPQFSDGSKPLSRLASASDAAAQAAQMPQATLDYLNSAPEAYLDCREGRHDYPRLRPHQMRFTSTPDGYDLYIADCRCCHMAFREELWLIREDANGLVRDMRLVSRTVKYRKPAEGEPAYLMEPGNGSFRATGLREMRVASHFVGTSVRRSGRQAESA